MKGSKATIEKAQKTAEARARIIGFGEVPVVAREGSIAFVELPGGLRFPVPARKTR